MTTTDDFLMRVDAELSGTAAETEQPRVIAYDPVLGAVDADSYAKGEPTPLRVTVDPEELELRRLLIDDAMNTPEAQEGIRQWDGAARSQRVEAEYQAEIARQERVRAAAVEALEYSAKIRDYLARYLVFPEAMRNAYLDVLTVWAIHTYVYKTLGVTPYLAITAPTQGSGKTTVEEVMSTVVHNPSGIEVTPTAPVVRQLAGEGRTLLLDEVDTLASDKSFVAVMNSGYKAGGAVSRVRSKDGNGYTETSNTFCPKIIAGIAREGSLPLPTATLERCIEIKIMRAKPGEITKRFRVQIMKDDPEVVALRDWASRWTLLKNREIRDAYFELPALSTPRAQEIWEPLVTLAGLLGDDWYERICSAALLLDGNREQSVDPNTALIVDVAAVVGQFIENCPGVTQLTTGQLAMLRDAYVGRKLRQKLSGDVIARRLGAFGLRTEVVDLNGEDAQVYTLIGDDGHLLPEWADVFDRYSA